MASKHVKSPWLKSIFLLTSIVNTLAINYVVQVLQDAVSKQFPDRVHFWKMKNAETGGWYENCTEDSKRFIIS